MREAGDGRGGKSWHSALITGRETAIYRLFTLEEMRAIEGSEKLAKFGAIEELELWLRPKRAIGAPPVRFSIAIGR